MNALKHFGIAEDMMTIWGERVSFLTNNNLGGRSIIINLRYVIAAVQKFEENNAIPKDLLASSLKTLLGFVVPLTDSPEHASVSPPFLFEKSGSSTEKPIQRLSVSLNSKLWSKLASIQARYESKFGVLADKNDKAHATAEQKMQEAMLSGAKKMVAAAKKAAKAAVRLTEKAKAFESVPFELRSWSKVQTLDKRSGKITRATTIFEDHLFNMKEALETINVGAASPPHLDYLKATADCLFFRFVFEGGVYFQTKWISK
jgi:hypothetical protein